MAVVKGVDAKIKAATEGVDGKKEEVDSKLRLIGNIVHDSVPDSNNEVPFFYSCGYMSNMFFVYIYLYEFICNDTYVNVFMCRNRHTCTYKYKHVYIFL